MDEIYAIEVDPDFDFVTLTNAVYKIVSSVNKFNGVIHLNWEELTQRNKALYVMLAKQIYEYNIKEPKEYFEMWKEIHIEDGWTLHRTLTWGLKFNPYLKDWEELTEPEKLQFQIFLFAIKELTDIFMEG